MGFVLLNMSTCTRISLQANKTVDERTAEYHKNLSMTAHVLISLAEAKGVTGVSWILCAQNNCYLRYYFCSLSLWIVVFAAHLVFCMKFMAVNSLVLNCLSLSFIHLMLELLTQNPYSNDKNLVMK